jgi:predicted anti-sigma-YlaC factor YlaD
VEQTQMLRRLAGRSQLAPVRPAAERPTGRYRRMPDSWPRWALGGVGMLQLGLAAAQAMGAPLGLPHTPGGGHVLNESTAWSAALGVVMVAAAIRPVVAGGLTWVLAAFAAFLMLYEVTDTEAGRATIDRPLTHLPVVLGAVLALLVWRRGDARSTEPDPTAGTLTDDIVLPDNASRGRRRGHLRSTDGSAA